MFEDQTVIPTNPSCPIASDITFMFTSHHEYNFENHSLYQEYTDRGRASRPLIFSSLQESLSKCSHAVSELATVYSVNFFVFLVTIVGQLLIVPPPIE